MQSGMNIVTSVSNDDIYIAFVDGRDARENGLSRNSNPYSNGPERNATLEGSWNNGWDWKDKR
jgi:hypothetical protein